ncbi:Xylosidase/arabinosidase [Lachnellula suecica]|uniref:Xylosidase/arabinosidase n=1 Tax=Lachnellula suecica TaxID=602035 RepID=A0A8T9C9M2_9HELO|nr:Xylosidase/arabinosidase [Lachnellula suecica]
MRRASPGINVIDVDFPDPAILLQGSTWYAYATSSNSMRFIFLAHKPLPASKMLDDLQPHMATAPAFEGPWTVAGDAMPDISAATWLDQGNPQTWAPDVVDMGDGTYIMYFAGLAANPPGGKASHCVGVAKGTSAAGPFVPLADTLFGCPFSGGGAIDPAGFKDTDGTRYVVYKVDGNNLGGGGNCGNGDGSHATPIMLQKLQSDGITPDGDPFQILNRDPNGADGPYIEAPSLRLVDGMYYLSFSSGCYCDDTYDISYATSTLLQNTFTKAQAPNAPLAVSKTGVGNSPGGADLNMHGNKIAFHYTISGSCGDPLVRGMRVANVTTGGGTIHFV